MDEPRSSIETKCFVEFSYDISLSCGVTKMFIRLVQWNNIKTREKKKSLLHFYALPILTDDYSVKVLTDVHK